MVRCVNVYRWHDKRTSETGLPNAFFVLWFPSGPQWKQCCSASKHSYATWCQRVSKTRTHLGPSPPYTAWLQNMQTDRASLDNPVCVPACDASPQVQTNSVSPACYSSCGFSVCKLCNWHIDICILQLCLLFPKTSLQELTHKETTHPPCMSLKVIKTRRLWLFDPIHTSWIKPWRKRGGLTFKKH